MIDLFNDVPTFVAAADAGSFSAAGRELNLSRSAVGKAVARIEARLSVRLFHRTTRAQVLTDEGRSFLSRCLRARDELREGAAELEAGQSSVTGVLRVTMPIVYGRSKVAPVLMKLAEQHPGLSVEMDLRDRHVSLLEEGFDLAVRSGPIGVTTGLSSKVIAHHQHVLCAAPSLIERLGMPSSLDDLDRYNPLTYRREGWSESWVFPEGDGSLRIVEPKSRARAADIGVLYDAALAGLGVAWSPDWLIGDALAHGRLLRLLPDLPPRYYDIHLVWASAGILPARLRIAIDALEKLIGNSDASPASQRHNRRKAAAAAADRA